jgi:2-hydroxy-3-keto-5-methylthiopentenyl-1-phosphate phosphatase
MKCHVFIDFDGTIVPRDATDFLLEQFALPAWRDVEEEWRAGRIGSRECMTRQVALLRVTRHRLEQAIAELAIDRGFASFVHQCRRRRIGMTVVSDGFDVVIDQMLRTAGLPLAFFANRLVAVGADRWRVTFPSARSDCRALAGNCKCAFTEPYATSLKVVIGDGRSDHCVAQRADVVFAKAELLALCRGSTTPHFAFADFYEVGAKLAAWLGQEHPLPRGEAVGAGPGT